MLFLILFFAAKDRANQLFKQVHEQKSLKGRSNDAIASACLYIACRQEGVPRTFKGRSDIATFQKLYIEKLKNIWQSTTQSLGCSKPGVLGCLKTSFPSR